MFSLLVQEKRLMRVDELRRGIESLEPNAYDTLTYYERWIASIAKILVEKGVLDQAEVDARIAEIEQRPDTELEADYDDDRCRALVLRAIGEDVPLEVLHKELDTSMALCGQTDVKDLSRADLLVPRDFEGDWADQ